MVNNCLLILVVMTLCTIISCSPVDIYNTRIKRIDAYAKKVDGKDWTLRQKKIAFWYKTKKEFPDYSEQANSIIDSINTYFDKLEAGRDTTEDYNRVNQMSSNFWNQIKTDTQSANERWSQGMQNAGRALLEYQWQQNQYYQNLNDSINTRTTTIGCRSDYDCDLGKVCIKKPYDIQGVCGESYDAEGYRTYQKDPDSFRLGTKECTSSLDCPTSFHCDPTYKKCLRK